MVKNLGSGELFQNHVTLYNGAQHTLASEAPSGIELTEPSRVPFLFVLKHSVKR